MKKATKSVTTPATPAPSPAKTKKTVPAAKPVKPAKVAPAPAPEVAKPKAKKAPVKKVVTKAVEPSPAPVAKAPAPVSSVTSITAQIDVGFGNALYLRGEGPGLSWEKGVLLDCVADDKWSYAFEGAERPIVFKFLLNDLTWSLGEDYLVAPGASVTVAPGF